MKFVTLGFVILSATCTLQVTGQEPLHMAAGMGVSFTADSIERQDPDQAPAGAYASVVHLRGNVVIRTCCVQKGLSQNQPPQAMYMRADDAVLHEDTGEVEIRGNARVSFQDYRK
jgi:hypothetical protein